MNLMNIIMTLESLKDSATQKASSGDLRITEGARKMSEALEGAVNILKGLPSKKIIYTIISEKWDDPQNKELSETIFQRIRNIETEQKIGG